MPKRGPGRTGGGGGQKSAQAGRTAGKEFPAWQWLAVVVLAVLAYRRLASGPPEALLPIEPSMRPEVLMTSMQRVKEQQSVSLSDVGQQLRFFCAEELDALSGGPRASASHAGGPPVNEQPPSKNCKTFAKSLPQVAKAIESTDKMDTSLDADIGEDQRLDRRLAELLRFQVDLDALQPVVLGLAGHLGTLEAAGYSWPRSVLVLLSLHLIHGDDQLQWERFLSASRASVLSGAVGEMDGARPGLQLSAALACQATLSDHAWFETAEEEARVGKLSEQLSSSRSSTDAETMLLLAVFGAYRPLLPLVERWDTLNTWRQAYATEKQRVAKGPVREPTDSNWLFWQLWRLAVEEPLVEKSLRQKLQSAGEATATSSNVRAMYERNPYPKWSWMHPPMEWPPKLFDWLAKKGWQKPSDWSESRPKVLVAGCGTGHWLTHFARHYSGHAEIWAMDLSLSSLSFAARKAEENGLITVNFVQGDILSMPEAIRKQAPFDFIEAGGVLHHLREPHEGWARLVELLRPGGAMLVALYSRIARARTVDPCRNFATRGGYEAASADSLRLYRHDVHARVDAGDKWAKDIVSSRDFASLNGVRDLCLHIQETQYTMLEIDGMIQSLGLQWIQMAETLHDDKQRKFRAMYGVEPFSPKATPTKWHEFEEKFPTTFLGMYEFYCQR